MKRSQRKQEWLIGRAERITDLAVSAVAVFRDSQIETDISADLVSDLRLAEAQVRLLRRLVEERLAGAEVRKCARCHRPMTGRPDRKFCSGTCRQAEYKLRRAG